MAASVVYTNVLGQVLMESRGGVETEFIPDPLGNVVKCKTNSVNFTYSAEYWPYGEIQASTGSNPSNFGYVGTWGYYQDSPNQTYVRARYYRPVQASWMTVDPLWPRESAFGYCEESPTGCLDPSGMLTWKFVGCNEAEKNSMRAALNRLNKLNNEGSLDQFRDCADDAVGTCIGSGKTTPSGPLDSLFNRGLGGDPKYHMEIQCNYNCKSTKDQIKCGNKKTFPNFPPVIEICFPAASKPPCGPLHCLLLHELLHFASKVGHDKNGKNEHLFRCINSVPGCEDYE